MNLLAASPTYNRENEQQARNAISLELRDAVKTSVALTRLLFIDQDTGETMVLSIESGAVVVAPL